MPSVNRGAGTGRRLTARPRGAGQHFGELAGQERGMVALRRTQPRGVEMRQGERDILTEAFRVQEFDGTAALAAIERIDGEAELREIVTGERSVRRTPRKAADDRAASPARRPNRTGVATRITLFTRGACSRARSTIPSTRSRFDIAARGNRTGAGAPAVQAMRSARRAPA